MTKKERIQKRNEKIINFMVWHVRCGWLSCCYSQTCMRKGCWEAITEWLGLGEMAGEND